jgi:hypothetical protein
MLRRTLDTLPRTWHGVYGRILASTDGLHREYAIKILQFLTHSERPLKVTEAIDIMATDLAEDPRFDPELRMQDPTEILKHCPSLISFAWRKRSSNEGSEDHEEDEEDDEEDDDNESIDPEDCLEIQLSHFSGLQYLRSQEIEETFSKDSLRAGSLFQTELGKIHARSLIFQVFLVYLSYINAHRPFWTWITTEDLDGMFSLLCYLKQQFLIHTMLTEAVGTVQKGIMSFLFDLPEVYTLWIRLPE